MPEKAALIAFRRSLSKEGSEIWAGQLLAPFPGQNFQFETGRTRFIGRGRGLKAPAAMFGNLSNNPGPSLDPILSLRRDLVLGPGERVRFAVITAAAASRNQIIRIIDKYRDMEAADRAFELAWTHSQLGLRYLRIQNEDVQRFQELASHMLYPNAGLRPGAERLRRNVLGQPGLWAFGISGDLPICTVVIGDPIDLGTVREVLQAHAFWQERDDKVQLGILATDLSVAGNAPASDRVRVYYVSLSGAKQLLKKAFPVEMCIDAYLLVVGRSMKTAFYNYKKEDSNDDIWFLLICLLIVVLLYIAVLKLHLFS